MTEREAQEIVRMIESNWSFDLERARGMWRTALLPYPPDLATRAVARLAETLHRRIQLSDLIEVLRMFNRELAKPVGEQRAALPPAEGKRGVETPEWVWIWSWCRFQRSPRNLRSFPQQDADPTDSMTTDEYEALRQEWIAAGKPKAEHPIPMARG